MLPPGGRWWFTQDPMFEAFQADGGLSLSWDLRNSKGEEKKMYGLYPSSMDRKTLMELLLDIPVAYRHAYEHLLKIVPCKAYVDFEWKGKADLDHSVLKRLVAAIRSKTNEVHKHDPKIHVCCGTRACVEEGYADQIKHSYHIVLEDIIYECNHDAQMRTFFTSIPGFTWINKEGDVKSMIDSSVYSRNRAFRLPLCTKLSSSCPLVRISGDPLKDDFTVLGGLREVEEVLPFFISNPEIGADCVFVKHSANTTVQQAGPAATKGQSSKRARTNTDMPAIQQNRLAVPNWVFQDLLINLGDTATTLGNPEFLPAENKWKMQGNHQGRSRKCLVNKGTIHNSNQALLFVKIVDSRYRVSCQCMSSECRSDKAILGYISFCNNTWQTFVHATFQHEAMQVENEKSNEAQEEPEESNEMQDEINESNEMQEQTEESNEMRVENDESNRMQEDGSDSDPDAPAQGTPVPDASRPAVNTTPIDPDDPDSNTYDMVKERFELVCFKVKVPFCYARIENGHDPCLHSHVDLQHYYCDWTYWGPNKCGKEEKLKFISEWLRDPNKRVVEKIVVDPTNTVEGVYNMWRGFDAEKLTPVDDALVPDLVHDITKHLSDVITGGIDDHTKFMEHYLANMIQRPEKKSQVALYLYGAQGCGKGIIFEFFRLKVLGKHCSYQTSKPEQDLFSRFANGAVNRVFIQVDETRSLHDHSDQIKDFITNPTLNYEKKGKDTIVLANVANLILTSNNANSLTVSPDDRRFALFQCSSMHKGDTDYFNKLGAHLERPEVARAYYQYLKSMDLSAYPISFQHARPITEYYKESQHTSIPIISRFFSALVNADFPEIRVPARDLYGKYVEFHTHGNYKYLMTETAFGRETIRVVGITKTRTKAGHFYLLEHPAIKKHLVDMNEYDADAEYQ